MHSKDSEQTGQMLIQVVAWCTGHLLILLCSGSFSLLYFTENLLQGSIATDKDSWSSFQDRPPEKVRESVIRFDPSMDEDDYCSDDDDPDKVLN